MTNSNMPPDQVDEHDCEYEDGYCVICSSPDEREWEEEDDGWSDDDKPTGPDGTTHLATNYYESIASLRAAERRLAEHGLFPQDLQDYREHGYTDMFMCPASDGAIIDTAHAYIGPNGQYYHNSQCAEVEQLINDRDD